MFQSFNPSFFSRAVQPMNSFFLFCWSTFLFKKQTQKNKTTAFLGKQAFIVFEKTLFDISCLTQTSQFVQTCQIVSIRQIVNILDISTIRFVAAIVYMSRIGDWGGKTLERKSWQAREMNHNDRALQYPSFDCKDYESITVDTSRKTSREMQSHFFRISMIQQERIQRK